ncbi:MAG: ABC transporter ATP-binding protein [Deltaproteobacteria bacterium RBG_19FT_COMBO_60_16]|nr:MAG: ABC transporter ATP-binding protein [Deltaproteobacteria bacterium RBG_19FT_COMBO_60_16]
MIHAENVTKVYNPGMPDEVTALHGVSVSIAVGEVAVLKGPSGSGKTSLLSLIGCMSRPTSGKVLVYGKDVAKLPERFLTNIRRKTFGFVFQQYNLVRDVSVLENVLLPLYPLDIRISEMREKARGVMRKLRIDGKEHLKVKQLSGGEQQRVAIARALINDPEVIIADEPTAHLDTELSGEFLEILSALNREGKTVVIATHDPFVHEQPMVDRIIAMRDGRIDRAVVR